MGDLLASLGFVASLAAGATVSSADACPSWAKEKRTATEAKPTFNLRNENRCCLNEPLFIIPSFLYLIHEFVVNHFNLG